MSLETYLHEVVAQSVRDAVAPLARQLEGIAQQLAKSPVATEWLTPKHVAKEFGLQPQTIRDWVNNGRLPAKRARRSILIRRSDLENFLANPGAAPTEKVEVLAERIRRIRDKPP